MSSQASWTRSVENQFMSMLPLMIVLELRKYSVTWNHRTA